MSSERPIPFSGDMVRAILDGRKSQTRRVIKPQPACVQEGHPLKWINCNYLASPSYDSPDGLPTRIKQDMIEVKCPYGKVDDLLWVRETFARWSNARDNIIYQDDPEFAQLGGQNIALNKLRASEKTADNMECVGFWQKVSPLFMPKWASRIWLEITNIRVERVQDITLADIKAEGLSIDRKFQDTKDAWIKLWDSLNAKRGFGWDKNPFVWVIEFKRIDK